MGKCGAIREHCVRRGLSHFPKQIQDVVETVSSTDY